MERNKGCMLRFFNIKFNGSDIQFILEIRLTSKFWLFLFLKFEVEIVMKNLSISEISQYDKTNPETHLFGSSL